MANKNLFIVVEGQDGSGKSTIAKILSDRLNGLFYQTPSGYYRQIRELVDKNADVIEHFLFYLAVIRYASQQIRDILQQRTVVCDRYFYSTFAYHRALEVGVEINIDQLQLVMPDYIFYLQISPETQTQRLCQKGDSKTFGDDWMVQQNIFTRLDQEFNKFPIHVVCAEHREPIQIADEIVKIIQKGETT